MDHNQYIDEGIRKKVKIFHLVDSRLFNFKTLIDSKYQSQLLDIVHRQGHIAQCTIIQPTSRHFKIFHQVYRQTCLIISQELFKTYSQTIILHNYIRHIIVVQSLNTCFFSQQEYKIVPFQQKELLNCLALQPASNFLNETKESMQFLQSITQMIKSSKSLSNKLNNFLTYLRITGLSEAEIKSVLQNHCKNIENKQYFLRFYCSKYQCYLVNILLRRSHQRSILELILFVIQGLYFDIKNGPKLKGPQICYRGGSMSETQAIWLKTKLRKIVKCRYFMSCTLNRAKAETFRSNCIFQIHFQNGEHAYLGSISQYQEQEQVLFNILTNFQLLSIRQDQSRRNKSWYVILKYIG